MGLAGGLALGLALALLWSKCKIEGRFISEKEVSSFFDTFGDRSASPNYTRGTTSWENQNVS